MIWHTVPGWSNNYEMTKDARVRHIMSGEVLTPVLAGPNGIESVLMKQGMHWYLKPLHELYQETFNR